MYRFNTYLYCYAATCKIVVDSFSCINSMDALSVINAGHDIEEDVDLVKEVRVQYIGSPDDQ